MEGVLIPNQVYLVLEPADGDDEGLAGSGREILESGARYGGWGVWVE